MLLIKYTISAHRKRNRKFNFTYGKKHESTLPCHRQFHYYNIDIWELITLTGSNLPHADQQNYPRQLEHWSLNLCNFPTKYYLPYKINLLSFQGELLEFTISFFAIQFLVCAVFFFHAPYLRYTLLECASLLRYRGICISPLHITVYVFVLRTWIINQSLEITTFYRQAEVRNFRN